MSKSNIKSVDSLTSKDLEKFAVWEYVNDDEAGELNMKPIRELPVDNLDNRLVGLQAKLNCGDSVWATLGNINVKHHDQNEHFLVLSVERQGKWFHLARYHDFDFEKRGPKALAKFLKLEIKDVFPISYDLRPFVTGRRASLTGKITKEPRKKLTRSEVIALAVKG